MLINIAPLGAHFQIQNKDPNPSLVNTLAALYDKDKRCKTIVQCIENCIDIYSSILRDSLIVGTGCGNTEGPQLDLHILSDRFLSVIFSNHVMSLLTDSCSVPTLTLLKQSRARCLSCGEGGGEPLSALQASVCTLQKSLNVMSGTRSRQLLV